MLGKQLSHVLFIRKYIGIIFLEDNFAISPGDLYSPCKVIYSPCMSMWRCVMVWVYGAGQHCGWALRHWNHTARGQRTPWQLPCHVTVAQSFTYQGLICKGETIIYLQNSCEDYLYLYTVEECLLLHRYQSLQHSSEENNLTAPQ